MRYDDNEKVEAARLILNYQRTSNQFNYRLTQFQSQRFTNVFDLSQHMCVLLTCVYVCVCGKLWDLCQLRTMQKKAKQTESSTTDKVIFYSKTASERE